MVCASQYFEDERLIKEIFMFARHLAVALTSVLATILMSAWAFANDPVKEPVILVATPSLNDQLFGTSVVIATPLGNGQHIGFFLNRPTPITLGEMFPDHEPSKKVTEPIFLGGPESVGALFALVQRPIPGSSSGIKLAADLYLEIEREKVDGAIENEHGHARFFTGIVVWQPGELVSEIRGNFWYVQDADSTLVLRKSTTGMWEDLIKRIDNNRHAITAGISFLADPDLRLVPFRE
jgi:putative transcriptional regulator